MTPAEQLRAAKALIDTPEKWTKGAFSRNGIGEPCRFDEATCFCTIGALDRATGVMLTHDDRAEAILRDAVPKDFTGDPVRFNDDPSTTHADIMKLFDDAIALAEAAQ